MTRIDFTDGRHSSRTISTPNGASLFLENNLFKLLLLTALAALVYNGQISLNIGFGDSDSPKKEQKNKAAKASLWGDDSETGGKKGKAKLASIEMPAGSAANFTFAVDPDFAGRNGVSEEKVARRMALCQAYIDKYAPVAVAESRKFGIPASITLAQGLLESDAGQSRLARQTNNHFGIKCFSRKCRTGHCHNFTDDTHKDFFVKYGSAWGSFRAHSEFLKNADRYSKLFKLASDDAAGWARGLSKAGYATDEKYAQKLVALINAFDLTRFDR